MIYQSTLTIISILTKYQNFNDTLPSKNGWRNEFSRLETFEREFFVKYCAFSIKTIKPWVQFGISPFGVWRNKSVDPRGSDTNSGQTNYDDLFADPVAWMENCWIDYLLPQLYWSIDHKTASKIN
jgi:uncharacterized lipoprotein YddW (UPF0748 family)